MSALIHLQTVLSWGKGKMCVMIWGASHFTASNFSCQKRLVIGTLSLNKLGKGSF